MNKHVHGTTNTVARTHPMNVQWDFGAVWGNAVVDDDIDFDPSLPCKWIPDELMLPPPPPPPLTPPGLFVGLTLTGYDGEVLETTGLMVGESVRRILASVAELFFWTAMCVLLGIVVVALVMRLPDSVFDRVRRRVAKVEEEEEEEEEEDTPVTTPGHAPGGIVRTMAVVHGGKPSGGQLLHYFKPETVAKAIVRRDVRKQEHPVRVEVVVQRQQQQQQPEPEEEEAEVGDKRGACDDGDDDAVVAREAKVARVEGEGEGESMVA